MLEIINQINMSIKTIISFVLLLLFFQQKFTYARTYDGPNYLAARKGISDFTLFENKKATAVFSSTRENQGVILALQNLKKDFKSVTGTDTRLLFDQGRYEKNVVIIGTIGSNPIIDGLIKKKKIDVSAIEGKWEASLTLVVEKPFEGVDKALVIVGSDRRGTIFGIYELSSQIGVSPWYWWADVPISKKKQLYIKKGPFIQYPEVKYRGIFLNDEAPALTRWAKNTFGGLNAGFYQHVFELLLRLKANYIWPAMWGNAFYVDDPQNGALADKMGIVMGTSHHEPLTRAHAEWKNYSGKLWDYNTNKEQLYRFWDQAVKERGKYESLYTLGMRGDGDEPMSKENNIDLLETIVKDQRSILEKNINKPVNKIPQVWALYKEVQEYYDSGMKVPDDVTLLFCDDNWGNLRRLPALNERKRQGGYGIYYHFDYVGSPRNYKWLNTNPIPKIWEQMNLAYQYGVDQLWVVNVGDLKPMEFPISFFLDMAWNPKRFNESNLQEYTDNWAKKQFGEKYNKEIGKVISSYLKFIGRVKPELLNEKTYSLSTYNEWETVVDDYSQLLKEAERLSGLIPDECKDAYFQLVLHPIMANSNLYKMYYALAKNRLYASQGRVLTNFYAQRVEELFRKDVDISKMYNKELANGKWDHMMDQVHIGYTSWNDPKENIMPGAKKIEVPQAGDLGVAIEGSVNWWPETEKEATLPVFNPVYPKTHYIELFNRGRDPLNYTVKAGKEFVKLSKNSGVLKDEDRIRVDVDWTKVPKGETKVLIEILSDKKEITVYAILRNDLSAFPEKFTGYVEDDGYLSVEAANFQKMVNAKGISWKVLSDHGRTGSAVSTYPVDIDRVGLTKNSPYLEYDIFINSSGDFKVSVYVSPTIDFKNNKGLQFAVSVDDEEPKIVSLHKDKFNIADHTNPEWSRSVSDNIKICNTNIKISKPGVQKLKIWMVDPGVVFQKIIINTGGSSIDNTYLGVPTTFIKK
jgi:hypothetical protein